MTTLPYGTWPSDISAADLATAAPRIDDARFVGEEVWWGEGLAAEGGRTAIFRSGQADPILPAPWNARSRVHEYGGGAWTVTDEGDLLFVEASDQRVWRLAAGSAEPVALTPVAPAERFGSLTLTGGQLLAVRETHTDALVPPRDIVSIALDGSGEVRSLAAGSDFLAQPRLSADASLLAWIAWDHPSMPWDRAELRVGAVTDDGVTSWRVVSRTDATQVEWTRQRELTFTDDPTGRWNLYRIDVVEDGEAQPIAPADADTGGPLWSLGSAWFAALEDGRIVAVRTNGTDELVVIDRDGDVRVLPCPLTSDVHITDVRGSQVLLLGASATTPTGVWVLDVDDPAHLERIRGGELPWDPAWSPVPRAVTFDGPNGPVHAFDYAPANPNVSAPDDELPPYVVLAHGGPTAHVSGQLSAAVAYLTSRGIGVLDVNYGGSTGYGRAYRERLLGAWGVADVDDVGAAAAGLAAAGLADPARLAVKGGSAGGLTVLGSLVRGAPFAAGISRYGVADLRSLLTDTHDFEARYLDGLVGRWPQEEAVYIERAPLTHAAKIGVPVLLLQGSEDPVVPPAQSESIRDALAANHVRHSYRLYDGESHGFRRADTIIDAAERELAFLGAAFGFRPDGIPPLRLD